MTNEQLPFSLTAGVGMSKAVSSGDPCLSECLLTPFFLYYPLSYGFKENMSVSSCFPRFSLPAF